MNLIARSIGLRYIFGSCPVKKNPCGIYMVKFNLNLPSQFYTVLAYYRLTCNGQSAYLMYNTWANTRTCLTHQWKRPYQHEVLLPAYLRITISPKPRKYWHMFITNKIWQWPTKPPIIVSNHPQFCPYPKRGKWNPSTTISNVEYNWLLIFGPKSIVDECKATYNQSIVFSM